MKIKSLSLILFVIALMAFFSVGIAAAEPISHDISQERVVLTDDPCGYSTCPGHIITGDSGDSGHNISILSGVHKITLADGLVVQAMNAMGPISASHISLGYEVEEYAAIYILGANGDAGSEITVEGDVILRGEFGILSIHDDELKIFGTNGDEAESSHLQINGRSMGMAFMGIGGVSFRGGNVIVGNDDGAYDENKGLPLRYGIYVKENLTLNDMESMQVSSADVDGYTGTDGLGEGGSVGIEVGKLFVSHSDLAVASGDASIAETHTINLHHTLMSTGIKTKELKAEDANLAVTAGDATNGTENPLFDVRSMGIYITKNDDVENPLNLKGTELSVRSGSSDYSYGIRMGNEDQEVFGGTITDSHITAVGGIAKKESIGLDAYHTKTPLKIKDSEMNPVGQPSNSISAGAFFEDIEVDGCDIKGIGGIANHESYGISVNKMVVKDSKVEGTADMATDPVGTDGYGVYSNGLYVRTLLGTNSEIYGKGNKALHSDGIFANDITLNGGMIVGEGYAPCGENEESYGIYLYDLEDADGAPVNIAKLELIGANVTAKGGTKGICAEESSAFAGVSYKADENDEAKVAKNFNETNFYFGNQYKVSYDNGGVDAENMPADKLCYSNETFLLSKEVPTAEGYQFVGWLAESGAVLDPKGDHEITVSNEDLVFVAVWKCLGGEKCILNKFEDLDPKEWYHDGIEFCLEHGVMNGMSKTTFVPDGETTRAMIVTTLYRMNSEPETDGKSEFSDVEEGTWYSDAVMWAAENGIVEGYPDGTFAPNKPATREELACILHRYAGYAYFVSEAPAIPETYSDRDEVSFWATEAMAWAIDVDIINGVSETTLAPGATSTRAQLGTMLQRLYVDMFGM